MTNDSGMWIRRASTAAGLAYTAIAEYELARRLGAEAPIAVMLPISIDCYVIAALKWFRALDVFLSLTLMGAAQVCAHALDAGVVKVSLDLVAVVSLLVPIALWRTHALARQTPQDEQDAEAFRTESLPSPPVQQPGPVTLERTKQQDAPETPELPPGTQQDTEDAPRLLTSSEVAQRCGVDPSTVRSWVANGRLAVHSKDDRGRNQFDPAQLPEGVAR
ncbi:helix-turn-helix domain-containing protein [Streptomyces sp. NPDC051954]|uniref:helix-turn-helix domain-containing protein n=1 Tax=Streptomyces sp. NPDC051954 TaxID=3155524 RepID=UPI00341EC046